MPRKHSVKTVERLRKEGSTQAGNLQNWPGASEKTEVLVRVVQRNSEADMTSLLVPVSVMGWRIGTLSDET
jgi:hypothetical protein